MSLASVGASVMALVSRCISSIRPRRRRRSPASPTRWSAPPLPYSSHLWPRWEFTEAPGLATGLLNQIDAFAAVALRPDATAQDYRLARKAMIEAIAALSDWAARMGGEPAAAQRGLEELAAMLIAAHGVVAQLSAARHCAAGRRSCRSRPGARRSGGGAALG